MTADLSRREFLRRSALVAGVGAVSPFAFVRDANANGDLALRRYLQRQIDIIKTPGIAAAVVRGNQVVWSAGAGWADIERGIPTTRDTVFQLASVSKTVTCAGIMTLVEDGVLDLDADVNRYLPFKVQVPAVPGVPITMRALLTHTSAIRDRWQDLGHADLRPDAVFPRRLADPTGRVLPLVLLGRRQRIPTTSELLPTRARRRVHLLEPGGGPRRLRRRVGGRGRLRRLVQRTHPRSAGHVGFRLTGWRTSTRPTSPCRTATRGRSIPIYQYGYPDYPDGALRTSAVHLARWLGAFMNGGSFQGDRVLAEDTVRESAGTRSPTSSRGAKA